MLILCLAQICFCQKIDPNYKNKAAYKRMIPTDHSRKAIQSESIYTF